MPHKTTYVIQIEQTFRVCAINLGDTVSQSNVIITIPFAAFFGDGHKITTTGKTCTEFRYFLNSLSTMNASKLIRSSSVNSIELHS